MSTEEEEVVYEEVVEAPLIEIGDFVKVKQVLDDQVIEYLKENQYDANYFSDTVKISLMLVAVLSAMVAQFYPIPFPQSRPLLGACCAVYIILSAALQFICNFVDKDTIVTTKPNKANPFVIRIRTKFPKFQEYYTLLVSDEENSNAQSAPSSSSSSGAVPPVTTARMYVGRYFTQKGEFDSHCFERDVQRTIKRYLDKKYQEFTYDHKTD